MDCENCVMKQRVEALEKDIERNQTTHREFYGKFEALGKQQAIIDERYSNIQATLVDIQADLRAIKEKPAKRWENITNAVLQWLVLAVLAAVVVLK